MIEFCNSYIPSGMCRPVEQNNISSKPASRQGCILNRMQERGVTAFSTERSIPNGIQFQKIKSLQIVYF